MNNMNMTQNFRAPTGGESIRVVCKNCGYSGRANLAGLPGFPSCTLASDKCPKCNKRKLEIDSRIVY